MVPKFFVDNLFEKVFELKQSITNAENSRNDIETFLVNNPKLQNVSPSKVANFLMQASIYLTKKNVSSEMIGNVYKANSVKFAILACQFDGVNLKKYAKIFSETLIETEHYTLEYKKSPMKHSRTVKVLPTLPIELFWLIPLFQNTKVLILGDLSSFISENMKIAKNVGEEFVLGYQYFVDNVTTFDKTNFKQFMQDSIKNTR